MVVSLRLCESAVGEVLRMEIAMSTGVPVWTLFVMPWLPSWWIRVLGLAPSESASERVSCRVCAIAQRRV